MSLPRGFKKDKTPNLYEDEVELYACWDRKTKRWRKDNVVVVRTTSGEIFVAPASEEHAVSGRRGPFKTLREACIAADTMYKLNAIPPEWEFEG